MANEVVITNVKIPFWSIVVLMIKLAFAAIPAMIIIMLIYTMIAAVLGGIFS